MSDTAKTAKPKSTLSDLQQSRVEAAKAARGLLTAQTGMFSSTAVDVFDLIRLAHWFITGEELDVSPCAEQATS